MALGRLAIVAVMYFEYFWRTFIRLSSIGNRFIANSCSGAAFLWSIDFLCDSHANTRRFR